MRTVFHQSPRSHVLRLAGMHADDDVAVPGPGVLAVKFAGTRWMIGMRMVPAEQFEAALGSSAFGRQDVFRVNGKTIARRVVAPINERKKLARFAVFVAVDAENGATGFMRIVLR